MSWDDRACIGAAGRCEGYRGAPCDCLGPWTEEELADAKALHRQILIECGVDPDALADPSPPLDLPPLEF